MMLSTIITIVYTVVVAIAIILVWGWWFNGYFRRRGVKSPNGYLPFLGNAAGSFSRTTHFKDYFDKIYKMHPNERYTGIRQFNQIVLLVRDIELLKQIAIKDFDHFLDHLSSLDENVDILFGNSLFSLRGQKWRDMRATLSPAFTSSKMRGMFQFVVDCGKQVADYYIDQMEVSENKVRGLIELEMKDTFTRYTNDVIATCAFGLEVNSFANKSNVFYNNGEEATDFSGSKMYKFSIIMLAPRLSKLLGIQFFSKYMIEYFRTLVWDTIRDREDRGVVRQDMINILMEARKGTLKHEGNDDGKEAGFAAVEESDVGKTIVKRVWNDDEIVAQAMLFFLAGFDTSSTLLCFMAHELALNPSIQKRLQEEIDEVTASRDGKLTYDCLQKMKYLDMVVSETLRKWPPSLFTDRKCIKPYSVPPPREGGKNFQMEPGNGIWIPIYSIHHDSNNFTNPETFDPERFSDENKHNIKPFTFIPFGIGPRNCIGSRFALMQAKAVMYNLLLKFYIVTTVKTQHPIKLKLRTMNVNSEKGFWLGLKPRSL